MPIDTPREGQTFYIRQFLNDEGHGGLAAVLAEVNTGDVEESYMDFGAELSLSDCNRTVQIDFGVYGNAEDADDRAELRKDLQNARNKAQRLADTISAFMEALEHGLMYVEADLDRRDAEAANKTQQEG
jgi:hypothetical protein